MGSVGAGDYGQNIFTRNQQDKEEKYMLRDSM